MPSIAVTESVEVSQMQQLAQRVVEEAARLGATAAECVVRQGRQLSVAVRLGETESIEQADGQSLGIRVFRGRRSGVTQTTDLRWPAVQDVLQAALAIAQQASEDPFAGLPSPAQQGANSAECGIYSEQAARVTPAMAMEWASRAERAALDCDPRLGNSDGGTWEGGESIRVLANSNGFLTAVRHSHCSLSVVPIAVENGKMQRDYWYSVGFAPDQLEAPESIGRRAAQRTLRRLGARKISTRMAPVVFDPQTARSLLGHILELVSGEAIYRKTSLWADRLGEVVASPALTITDDGTRYGGFGTRPSDAEGVPTQVTPIIAQGRLESYLLNCYAARKLGLRTTGNAARGLAGPPGVSCGNFTLEPGSRSPESILREAGQGLYVTGLIGFGFNPVTGDYSRGASGLWIENGELAYPVEEVTIAGNLGDMLRDVQAIGNDPDLRGAVSAPTIMMGSMTVAGN